MNSLFLYKIVEKCQNKLDLILEVYFMKDCVLISMALGFIVGAIVVSNNSEAQKMVEKGKKAVKEQVKKMTN